MKIKYWFIYILLISLFVNLNVYAINDAAIEGDSNYSSMESAYNKYNSGGILSVKSSEKITLYGKSECNGSSCTYKYAGINSTNFKEALSNLIVCTNGEKYFVFQAAGTGKTDYLEDNKGNTNGTVYWSEEYQITCTNNSSNNGVETLESTKNPSTNSDQSQGTNNNQNINQDQSQGTNNNQNTNQDQNQGTNNNQSQETNNGNGEYDSSTPGDVSETGVSTYFIVLGLVAAISFGFMLIVKKYNLFKSV